MNTNPLDKSQADKFRDMARELECDEDEAAFEDRLRKVVQKQEEPGDHGPPGSND